MWFNGEISGATAAYPSQCRYGLLPIVAHTSIIVSNISNMLRYSYVNIWKNTHVKRDYLI